MTANDNLKRNRNKSTKDSSSSSVTGYSFKKSLNEGNDDYIKMTKNYVSNQDKDPYKLMYGIGNQQGYNLRKPPFDLQQLRKYPNESNILKQCIDAMVINTVGFGYRLEFIGENTADTGESVEEDSKEALAEKKRIEDLLTQPNADITLTELLMRKQMDKEILGNSYIEVARDTDNSIVSIFSIPGETIRICSVDEDPVMVPTFYNRNGKVITKVVPKYFRRYVQLIRGKMIYFKEFGDPRIINKDTGRQDLTLQLADSATELIYDPLYYPGDIYGLPRWINQLSSVLGAKKAELLNLRYFEENAIPAMVALISGGNLNEKSLQNIQDHFVNKRGGESQNRILILEAESVSDGAIIDGKQTSPRVDLKPLSGERQQDELFQEYIKNAHDKIRSAFRLPKMYVGYTDDMNRSTADQAVATAERQVFIPERNKIDDIFNLKILTDADGHPSKYWRYRSNPPRMASSEEILDGLKVFGDLKAITPNIAIGIANELYDLKIPRIEHEWGDLPSNLLIPQSVSPDLIDTQQPTKDSPPAKKPQSSED